jgi:hypothetical protein
LRVVQWEPQARPRQAEQVVLEARERVPRQPQVLRTLQRGQARQVQADQRALRATLSIQVRRYAAQGMFCFAKLGCRGAWARPCDPSAERWNNTTVTSNPKRDGRRVKPDAVQALGAIRQAAEHAPGIRVLLLRRVEGHQSTIRHPTIRQQVKVQAH